MYADACCMSGVSNVLLGVHACCTRFSLRTLIVSLTTPQKSYSM
jgi:hypothetical protein